MWRNELTSGELSCHGVGISIDCELTVDLSCVEFFVSRRVEETL